MPKDTKEDKIIDNQKLKYIGLDLDNIAPSLLNVNKISYRPLKSYDDNNYKVYKYVDINKLEILITPSDRLDDLNDKLKNAKPLAEYLDGGNPDLKNEYETFLNMLDNLDIEKLEEIEREQKEFNKHIPYKVKYRNNYIWQIYYSEVEDKYFMLFSSNDSHSEALFYVIKKKLHGNNEKIFVPISHLEHTSGILKRTEISDLENYLWFFTKEWPNIYEVFDENNIPMISILGKTKVYEDIKSIYKISLRNKEEGQNIFKLIKALFILQSNDEMEYDFKTVINEGGSIDFCYNLKKITYENISEFIRQEVEVKQEKIKNLHKENIIKIEELQTLKEIVEKQKDEYLLKEKQITSFLECKKTFFGRVRFFLKKSRKTKQDDIKLEKKEDKNTTIIEEIEYIENKDLYTIEDLLKVCNNLKNEELQFKNMQMDIKALELKKENLEKKIQNATLYINEIESHTKSIFDFWKFTNKDTNNMLVEGKQIEENTNGRLKKQFNFDEDIEDFGKKIDYMQRTIFNKNECDAIFAIRNDVETFELINKDRMLKKDEASIENRIKQFQKEYMDNIDTIQEKDFDIFGNVAQDKTKIKTLKNNKHREIEKDKYKILEISPNTTLENYKDNIKNYKSILDKAYGKMKSPCDFAIYKADDKEFKEIGYAIFDLNEKSEINQIHLSDKTNLIKLNVKEGMPIIFYSNIMFFDNMNQTLPEGMDVETKVLIDLSTYNFKLVSRKDFNLNTLKNEFEEKVQKFQVYEYNLEVKGG